MGIYDRDYYRQGGSGFRLRAPRSAIGAIILLNIAVYVVEAVQWEASDKVTVAEALAVHVNADNWHDDTLHQPWMWWQFLTYGFVHSPFDIWHILFNMMVLFFLGRDVEQWYGTREFIRLYLVTLVFSSLVFALTTRLVDPQARTSMYGASGAITGVVVLYAFNFPRRMMLFMFVIPMPAWLLGAIVVAMDIWGTLFPEHGTILGIDPHTAFTTHLGGAAFAAAYFLLGWNFGRFYDTATRWIRLRSRPSLRVFKPDDQPASHVADEEVDRILEKIHREGEGSLRGKSVACWKRQPRVSAAAALGVAEPDRPPTTGSQVSRLGSRRNTSFCDWLSLFLKKLFQNRIRIAVFQAGKWFWNSF